MRLLVIEDERKVADFVARGLRAERFAVDVAYDGDSRLGHGAGLRLRPDDPRPHAAGLGRGGDFAAVAPRPKKSRRC